MRTRAASAEPLSVRERSNCPPSPPPEPLRVRREECLISLLLYAQVSLLVGSLAGQMGSQGIVSSPLTLREVTRAGTLSAQGHKVSLAHKAVTIPLETMKA